LISKDFSDRRKAKVTDLDKGPANSMGHLRFRGLQKMNAIPQDVRH
jgi:hypothetical protein